MIADVACDLEASREMSARSHHYPVQILRSPETRPRELVFGLDAATASLASPVANRTLSPFFLPPSPPYTNPHMRRAIPLPLLSDVSINHTDSMDHSKHTVQCAFLGTNGPSSLLSPPYSPRRRTLTLLSLDEDEGESKDAYGSVPTMLDSPAETDESCWRKREEGDDNSSEPPSMKLKDLDLGEETDDWDEPLFLNEPSVFHSSDGLALNLFGAIVTDDYEGPSRHRLDPPSSPAVRSSSLPDLDYDLQENDKPLFDPSDFDVFENGWDTIKSEETQSTSFSADSDDSLESLVLAAPNSPSRRSFIGLPTDELTDISRMDSLFGNTALNEENVNLATCTGESLQSSYQTSHGLHKRPLFDVHSDAVQTPFSIPLLLHSSISHSHCSQSLLFCPLEPQDVPLPESPESQSVTIQADCTLPLHVFEESRIRLLHREMLAMESQAKTREALLTEFIARLNAMKPPSLPCPVSTYRPTLQSEISSTGSVANDSESIFVLDHTAQSSLVESDAAFNSSEFFQARRREVRNAIAMRAAERRRRKLMKERIREIDALLQLKARQLFSADSWTVNIPRGRRSRNEGAIVLTASGSDRHLAHANATLSENGVGDGPSSRERQSEIMQLVAKMILRRRDSSRPLSGRSTPIVRKYVRSGLSRRIDLESSDYEDTTNLLEELRIS